MDADADDENDHDDDISLTGSSHPRSQSVSSIDPTGELCMRRFWNSQSLLSHDTQSVCVIIVNLIALSHVHSLLVHWPSFQIALHFQQQESAIPYNHKSAF